MILRILKVDIARAGVLDTTRKLTIRQGTNQVEDLEDPATTEEAIEATQHLTSKSILVIVIMGDTMNTIVMTIIVVTSDARNITDTCTAILITGIAITTIRNQFATAED